jgi:hypothetical protein
MEVPTLFWTSGVAKEASLGHATAAFTLDVYGHVTASGLEDAAATLERVVFGDTMLDQFLGLHAGPSKWSQDRWGR